MEKKHSHNKLKKSFFMVLIVPILMTFLISGKEKIKPADLLPNPKMGYIYGKFHAFGGDAFSIRLTLGRRQIINPNLTLYNMDNRDLKQLYFVQDLENNNNPYFVIPLEPGIYIVSAGSKNGDFQEPLNEEFEVAAGKIYYMGNYLTSYKPIPLVENLVSEIQVCNHFSETTGIIKRKFPHFANLPVGSIYQGEPECTEIHTDFDLLKDSVGPQRK